MGLPSSATAESGEPKKSFSHSLVILLLIFSLLPIGLVGTGTYLRARQIYKDQVTRQLEEFTRIQSYQLNDLANASKDHLNRLVQDKNILKAVQALVFDPNNPENQKTAVSALSNDPKGSLNELEKHVYVFSKDGVLLAATDPSIRTGSYQDHAVISALLGTSTTLASYHPAPFGSNHLVIFSSLALSDSDGHAAATIVSASSSPIFESILTSSLGLNPAAQGQYLLSDQTVLVVDPQHNHLVAVTTTPGYLEHLTTLQTNAAKRDHGYGQYPAANGQKVLGSIQNVPALKMALVIEVPVQNAYRSMPIIDPVNFFLSVLAVMLSGALIFTATRTIVIPIQRLVKSVQKFIAGDRSQRVWVDRRDEIGFLAKCFNHLMLQINDLDRLMEEKVERRTQQVRVASEVAQIVTSTNDRTEMAQRAVQQVVERFGYLYAGMYIVDSTNIQAVLRAEQYREPGGPGLLGSMVRAGAYSLIGWVLGNNQVRTMDENTKEAYFQETLAPGARSQVAAPVSMGEVIYGVLVVQSDKSNAFDREAISILQIVTNQVAAGLRNIRMLETAQVDLEETSLLYHGTQQIAQAITELDVMGILTGTLGKCPFVSGVYSVDQDHIRVLSVQDPDSTGSQSSATGIRLPLMDIAPHFSKNNPVILEDIARPGPFANLLTFFARRGCVSAVIFPLFESETLSKIIILSSREGQRLTDASIRPYANFFAVTASTLGRLKILENLSQTLLQLQAINQVSQAVSMEFDLQKVYSSLHEQILKVVGRDVEFAVTIFNARQNMIEIPYMSEGTVIRAIDPFPLGEGLTSHVLTSQKTLMINTNARQRAEELGAKVVGQPARSWLGVPLNIGGKVIGALILQDLERENRFAEEDARLVETVAAQVAVTIRNAQLLAEMQSALNAYDQERFLLKTLLENTPDLVYFKDTQGRYIRSSASYAAQLGTDDPQNLIGKLEQEIAAKTDPESAPLLQLEREILVSGKQEIGRIEQTTLPDGTTAWALVSLIPMHNPNHEIVGLLGISRDITGMKNAEAAAQKNAQQIRTAAEVARDASGTLDIVEILSRAVNLIRDRFGFYHASIFLMDASNRYAELRESTGEAGRQMKASNHRLAVGSQSIVGQATSRGEALVINDVTHDPTYYANPLLPDTCAELAIPLKIGARVLGALDVQSTRVNDFGEEDVSILQVLADQLAIAVYNAQLFATAQQNLSRHRLIHEVTTTAASKSSPDEVLHATTSGLNQAFPGYRVALYFPNQHDDLEIRASAGFESADLSGLTVHPGQGPVGIAAESRRSILIKDANLDPRFVPTGSNVRSQLAVPILYSGKIMGVLDIDSPRVEAFDENDLEILGTLGNSLGAILYNAQLIGEVRRQVERQRLIYEATSRIRRSVDIETILKTSAAEICRALGANRVRIEIDPNETAPAEDQA